MDNVGDWLYIVFIVIAAVSSLFSSIKKKENPTEILGQPGSEKERKENTPPRKSVWDTFDKKKKKAEPVPFITGEGRNIPVSKMVIPPSGLVEPEQDYSPEISIDSPEDLRRAIIYSEILNRKY